MKKILHLIHPSADKKDNKANISLEARQFNAWFQHTHALKNIDFQLPSKTITCIIGPSGSGKSTLIRSINRINDDTPGFSVQGSLVFNGSNIYTPGIDVSQLRRNIGMVFQKPCVFPRSIADNVLFGLDKRPAKKDKAETCKPFLEDVFLWQEVAHRLHEKASTLSIGQQQRLCLARTLAVKPSLILLDEPTSSLDPVSTQSIEKLMLNLKQQHTVLFVTHNIQQARRIADRVIFMCDGQIIEQADKQRFFSCPRHAQTKNYLNNEICEC